VRRVGRPPARLATLFLRVQLVDIGVEGVVDAVEEDVRRHEEVRRKPDSDRREQLAHVGNSVGDADGDGTGEIQPEPRPRQH